MGVVGLRELVHINKLNTDVQQIEGNNSKLAHLQEVEQASSFVETSFLSSVESICPPLYTPFANWQA